MLRLVARLLNNPKVVIFRTYSEFTPDRAPVDLAVFYAKYQESGFGVVERHKSFWRHTYEYALPLGRELASVGFALLA